MEEKNKKEINNLLDTTNTITSAFGRLKFVSVTSIICMAVTAIACVVYIFMSFDKMQQQIFVLDKGQVLTASRENLNVSLRDRIEFQSRNLHKLLFTVTPNRDIVTQNIESALEISDKSVYTYYNTLQERKFYQKMFQSNASQDIRIDSVKIDISRHPYAVATFATLSVLRETNVTKSTLVTRCNMVEVGMNRKNREGLQVEDFEVLKNDVIEQRKR